MTSFIRVSVLLCFFILSCDNDDKVALTNADDREIGAYVRTTETVNSDFSINNPNDIFRVELEAHDEQNGGLLDAIEVYLTYKQSGGVPSNEVLLKTLERDVFTIGQFGKPVSPLTVSFEEALDVFNLTMADMSCKDQFEVRINQKLTDGRSFTTGQSSSKILAADDFWSSPFCYTINVIEPIAEDMFTGIYQLESVLNGPLGPTFGDGPQLVEVYKGHSTNVREMRLRHRLSIEQELPRIFRFTIVCNESVFSKDLLSSKIGFCGIDPAILLGPDTVNATIDPNDDTVFELWFVEGYLGFDGNCGFGTAPSRIRLSKQ
ncbi:hypothetical protein [uncultured Dokdonia sp.]|uniref:hypothetical protein n=1 Tax=uncultured Dokdonia sp. TaxID=575653 RepID=UPI0026332E30|nr:hypothetical protein [uncultured Dokdonia sp.]